MVSEWEKEELGRLTLRNLKAVPSQDSSGKMTHQNLQSLKGAQKKTDTHEVKVKSFFEGMKNSMATAVGGLFSTPMKREVNDMCREYGHKWIPGKTWEGRYPKCMDCKEEITDPSQLRGAVPKSEKVKYRSGRP